MEEMRKNVESTNNSDVNNIVLRIASENGKLDAVKRLYECGADITSFDNYAIRIAAENGHLNVVKFLHENGADITANNNYAIKAATANKHLEVVEYLVANGANTITKNDTSINVKQAENTSLERDVVPANSNVTYEYGKEKIYTKIINFTDRDIELISIDAFTIVMSVDLKTKDGIINVQKTIELDKKYKIPLYVEVYENTNINYKYDNEDSDHDELVVVIDSTNGYVKINSCMFRCYLHALQDIKNKTELLKNNYAEFIIS